MKVDLVRGIWVGRVARGCQRWRLSGARPRASVLGHWPSLAGGFSRSPDSTLAGVGRTAWRCVPSCCPVGACGKSRHNSHARVLERAPCPARFPPSHRRRTGRPGWSLILELLRESPGPGRFPPGRHARREERSKRAFPVIPGARVHPVNPRATWLGKRAGVVGPWSVPARPPARGRRERKRDFLD